MKVYIVLFDEMYRQSYSISVDCLGIFSTKHEADQAIKLAKLDNYEAYVREFELDEIIKDGNRYGTNFGWYAE